MRIARVRVDSFGRLAGLDTGAEPLGPLVVVLGPNEAGKSTLFSFLTTTLYGFQPASRERNPHVPWGSDEAGGVVQLQVGNEEYAEVERRLRSAPSAKLTHDGRTREIRNQPLPWVEHVPRTVFRQVFAVTLADLAGLDEETWGRIQDRVLGSMGAADLHPARAVAETLEHEAGEIWRPNRRGNQRLRAVQDTIRTLRSRRLGALERDREIRALVDERDNVQVLLADVRAERQHDYTALERVQELLPLKRQLERIDSLREEGGPREELAALPSNPRVQIHELEVSLTRLRDQLDSTAMELEAPASALADFDDSARLLLAKRDRISRFLIRAASVQPDHLQASKLSNEMIELDFRTKTASDQFLTRECDEETSAVIGAVSVELLRDRVNRLERMRHGGQEGDARTSRHPSSLAMLLWAPTAMLGGVGLGLTGWGLYGGPVFASTIGAALLGTAVTLAYLRAPAKKIPSETGTGPGKSEDERSLEQEISELLRGVPVRDDYRVPPGAPLVSGLERLQTLIHEGKERAHALERASERLADADADAIDIATSLGRNGTQNAQELSHQLEQEVRSAERAQVAASAAEREQARLVRVHDTLTRELEELEGRHSKLLRDVDTVGTGPSGASRLDIVQRRLDAHTRANQLEDELAHTYPDLDERKAKIHAFGDNGTQWARDEEDIARRKTRLEDLGSRIEELVERAEALGRDATHLRELETIDVVDSEIATLQEIEDRLVIERDRKWVLAQLIREADRRFREKHQPDLIRRASSYLEHLTGGRYDHLLVDETGDGDLFQLVGPGIRAPIPLARPISTGTLEQAYLSLRLAIVDHLDHGSERLPLFIDEAFVNWDDERRDRGLEVLANVSSSRQVFAFTCHPEMAERLESWGGRVLRLESC